MLQAVNWRKQAVKMFRRSEPLISGANCDHINLKKFPALLAPSPNSESRTIPLTLNSLWENPEFMWWILCKVLKVSGSSACENVNFGDSGMKKNKTVAKIKLGRQQIKIKSRQGFIVTWSRLRWKFHSWFNIKTADVGSSRLKRLSKQEARIN